MIGFLFLAAGLVCIGAALFVSGLSAMATIVLLIGGAVLAVLGGFILLITTLYTKTSQDMSFVRTGMGGSKAVIGGGCFVIPVVHKLLWVPLRTFKLEIGREGDEALICKDKLRADVKAQFYINVPAEPEMVKTAARTVGERFTQTVHQKKGEGAGDQDVVSMVQELIFEKLDSALRQVAAVMDLFELQTERETFQKQVEGIVRSDLMANGFNLESSTITKLDQTSREHLKEDNVFDAEGLRKMAEITQAARVRTNQIEREAELQVTRQNVETRKSVLMQEQDQQLAEAEQQKNVANARAERTREAEEMAQEQRRLAETARIKTDEGVAQRDLEKERAIIAAEQEKETADVRRKQAIDVSERQAQIAVAEAEEQRAAAQAKQLLADAKREEASQAVLTVQETAAAEREARVQVINATAEADKNRVTQEKKADAEAYTVEKAAEAQIKAAENKARAIRTQAQADRDAKALAAEGLRAEKMVPVEVDAEQVNVEQARVEVLKQELEAKKAAQEVSVDLEKAIASISAAKEVGIEQAQALGAALQKAQMTIYGDPNTLAQMVGQFMNGQGISAMIEGFMRGTTGNGGGAKLTGAALTGVAKATSALLKRLGFDVDSSQVAEMIRSLEPDKEKTEVEDSQE